MVGKILGDRYEIIEEIGNGGMAIVYKAKCRKLNRVVAIKVLKDEYKVDEEFVKKFNRESQAAASLSHPNIVSVYDVGHDDGIYYIVMELVEGVNLKDYILKNPKMDWRVALKYSMQICSALAHAHRNGIIHRDIKPHNIILSKDGNCKVTDFGIAFVNNMNETKKIDEGILGSVHYISPEHAKGVITDERSDIYSLGVTMYEMLTGVLPFDSDNAVSVAVMHINSDPKPIKDINIAVPLTLVQIVKKAMSKDILGRYQSANEMYKDLYELSNEPDVFVLAKEEPSDLGVTKVISKEETEEIKNKIQNGEKEIVISIDNTPQKKEEEKETVQENKKAKKGFFKDLFKAENKKDKVAIISALAVSVILIGMVLTFAVGILAPGIFNFGSNDEYKIPKFVGSNIEDIKEEYKDIDIEFIITEEQFNDEYNEGIIITQNPDEGMNVKLPVKVRLTVSKGSREIVLSNYVNKEARQAELEITEQGLKYVEKTEYDEEVPAGYVISQYPLAKTKVLSGTDVTITVSKGANEEFAVVPNLIGLTEAEAKAKLTDYELVLGGIIREASDKEEGRVIAQSAPANSELVKKSKVTLTLSNGKKPSSNQGGTTENNPSKPDEPDEPEVTLKKYTLTLNLPSDKDSVTVKVDQDGKTVYNKSVKTSQKTLNITLEGNGNHNIVVYYDGLLIKTQKIKI
ncbi:MAG: Stk1 family PASTA domain-containing Ser/Thr kinase [Ruminococcaceae bacterium]|nr:Stk1 family PASTA domain-containing Ser/Thr kinase [Oscillospiraceae bacterium]